MGTVKSTPNARTIGKCPIPKTNDENTIATTKYVAGGVPRPLRNHRHDAHTIRVSSPHLSSNSSVIPPERSRVRTGSVVLNFSARVTKRGGKDGFNNIQLERSAIAPTTPQTKPGMI